MASVDLAPAQRRTLDALIGTGDRPVFPADLVPRIRDRIEEAVRAFEPERPLWLGKSNLSDLGRCPGLFDAVRSGERGPFAFSARFAAGRLAHKAVELEVSGREDRDLHDLVEQAADRLQEDQAFAAWWDDLDGLRRDETLMDVAKTLELFRSTMPPLRAMRRQLSPCTEWHVKAELLGGTVVLSGTLDLVLGSGGPTLTGTATRLAIDLKTGRAWPEHAEDMRFYALLLSLRFGVPPYRVATLYLDSGEWQAEDVDERVLSRAADRVVEAVRAAAASDAGRPAELRPGPFCTWCPRAATCPSSTAPSTATS
ncbi:MAG TPA: PD-(D/E)XK nuclease family protein [Actinomycetota bacterium]|nr:PD-(D/E)XK nuclease family protein [Actinomycetota bacterium]